MLYLWNVFNIITSIIANETYYFTRNVIVLICKYLLFNYLTGNHYKTDSYMPVLLNKLELDKKYTVKEVNLYPETKSPIQDDAVFTGDFLMKVGINPVVNAGRTSVILEIDEVK